MFEWDYDAIINKAGVKLEPESTPGFSAANEVIRLRAELEKVKTENAALRAKVR